MTSRCYSFHHLSLNVSAEDALMEALDARLGRFKSAPPSPAPHAEFRFCRTVSPEAEIFDPDTANFRPVLSLTEGHTYYSDASRELTMEIRGQGSALCDLNARSTRISYKDTEGSRLWHLSHPFFTVALTESLKQEGLFALHAAGLGLEGQGLLIAGHSGSGKSTLALALLRAGFGFLSDDTVFLQEKNNRLQALAFPDEVDVTDETVTFFPELGRHLPTRSEGDRRKRGICAAAIYGAAPCWSCAPTVLVFPEHGRTTESKLTPIQKAEALAALACNVVRTDRTAAQAHLNILARLVGECRCYRLFTGRDFDQLPAILRRALLNPKSLS